MKLNDFKELKRKMDFSSTAVDTDTESTVLKSGMGVVLMDSNFRGKIQSVRKDGSIIIELEDNLTVKAYPGEFAVTNSAEIECMQKVSVRKSGKITQHTKNNAGKSSRQLSIDLHIDALLKGHTIPKSQHLEYQLSIFRSIMQQNIRHKGMKITFIHGIGEGILKSAIRKELDEKFCMQCSYNIGDPAITTVTIR